MRIFLLSLVLIAIAAPAGAASFNCKAPTLTPLQTQICNNPMLSHLSDMNGATLIDKQSKMLAGSDVLLSQKTWGLGMDTKCGQGQCSADEIEKHISKRVEFLQSLNTETWRSESTDNVAVLEVTHMNNGQFEFSFIRTKPDVSGKKGVLCALPGKKRDLKPIAQVTGPQNAVWKDSVGTCTLNFFFPDLPADDKGRLLIEADEGCRAYCPSADHRLSGDTLSPANNWPSDQ